MYYNKKVQVAFIVLYLYYLLLVSIASSESISVYVTSCIFFHSHILIFTNYVKSKLYFFVSQLTHVDSWVINGMFYRRSWGGICVPQAGYVGFYALPFYWVISFHTFLLIKFHSNSLQFKIYEFHLETMYLILKCVIIKIW